MGIKPKPEKAAAHTPREERIIAGFEDIQRFIEQHGRPPAQGEGRDIFERLYATRLDRLRRDQACLALIAPFDHQGLLDSCAPDDLSDDELLAALGLAPDAEGDDDDLRTLRHVKPRAAMRAAADIANQKPCADFARFRPILDAVQKELANGTRKTQKIRKDAGFRKADIVPGRFFILGGQLAYVAEVGDVFSTPNKSTDARLRVIYANGTESDLLLRSMQRALYKDKASRIISEPDAGPLFANASAADDTASGTIYVLRSRADHPAVNEHRDVLHKIGVTGGSVKQRIANAAHDPTFLLADVEIVATYELFNINRARLEHIIHTFFEPARLTIEIKDRFGRAVTPREWFLAPLPAIDHAVDKIKDGTIGEYVYDPNSGRLARRG